MITMSCYARDLRFDLYDGREGQKISVQNKKIQNTKFQTEFISEHKIQTEIISEHKISVWIHFRAQNFRLDSFQGTKFQTEFISEHKISDWNHFKAQNFKLNSFQSTKFQIEIISGTKFQTSVAWVNWVRRVDWHRDLDCSCQGHAAILGKYLLARNFGTEQASDARLVSRMGKSGTTSRLASRPWSYFLNDGLDAYKEFYTTSPKSVRWHNPQIGTNPN